ncbi:hypothetical protein Tco_0214849 [Tanacetum coccineum]
MSDSYVYFCVDREGTQGSGSGGWDGGGGVGKIFEKYHVGGGFVSTVNEAAMSFILKLYNNLLIYTRADPMICNLLVLLEPLSVPTTTAMPILKHENTK